MDSIDPAALSLSLHPRTAPHVDPSPSPTPSTSSLAAAAGVATTASSSLPPKPDRAKHDAIKARYKVLQHKWHDLIADRTKLASDLEAAELKREKLQSEADMLIEQMHELAPEISLAPDYVDLSSDEADETHDGYMHPNASSSKYLDGRYGHHLDRRRLSISDSNVPSSSINYFSGQLFGPNSGLDFESDMAIQAMQPSGSGSNGKGSDNGGHNGKSSHANAGTEERQVMLSPEQAKEEEARIEQEQKARQRSKSYNPDNVKIRIGVMPSTFVHPLVHNNSNRSSKSRSPSTTSDQAIGTAGGDETSQSNGNNAMVNAGTSERPTKRPRRMSKEKSPIKEQNTINEEDEPNPP